MFRFFVIFCFISFVFEDQLIKTRRWCSEMKVWIGHLVSPIRPTLCPHPSLSGQQTNTATSPTLLQHYNRNWHLYNWLFEQQYNVLRLLRRPRCIIPGDSIATFGFRRSETWATRSSAKWQINNAADPSSQLGQQLFLSFIQQHGKLTSLAAINQSCCFSFAFLGGFHDIIQWTSK